VAEVRPVFVGTFLSHDNRIHATLLNGGEAIGEILFSALVIFAGSASAITLAYYSRG
jgi:hypothetical protein